MEWKIDLSDLKESAVRRMLRDAITTEQDRALPLHRRAKKKLEVESEDDEATEEADEENEKLVSLAEEQGQPKELPITNEDVSEEAGDKLTPPKKPAVKTVAGKLGKPYSPS